MHVSMEKRTSNKNLKQIIGSWKKNKNKNEQASRRSNRSGTRFNLHCVFGAYSRAHSTKRKESNSEPLPFDFLALNYILYTLPLSDVIHYIIRGSAVKKQKRRAREAEENEKNWLRNPNA